MENNDQNNKGSFWTTLPGCLTGLAALITAIGGIITILFTLGVLPLSNNTNTIAGHWIGTIEGLNNDFSATIEVSILDDCKVGSVCGTYAVPSLPCSGNLTLTKIEKDTFVFIEQRTIGEDSCGSGGYEYVNLLSEGKLSWAYGGADGKIISTTILTPK